jgi:quinol monooxygenase YgiN
MSANILSGTFLVLVLSIMIISIIKIYPPTGSEHTIIDVLESVKVAIANLYDCLECFVAVEAGEDGQVCYMEHWRTREALDRHLRSPLYGRVLEAMELSRIPPEVTFFKVSKIDGLELVGRLRVPPIV